MDALVWSRLQFGFTATYHYLFPQLTMGLALLIVVFKVLGIVRRNKTYDEVARFWAIIFGINFAVGVVTGIPLEFQFGTNWARFANTTGGVIGMTLALEGMFAFFAESAFLGVFLYGEKRFSPRTHLVSAIMLFVGSWLSGFFIIVTNGFMQHPAGYTVGPNGTLQLAHAGKYLLNPWSLWEYAHNMTAAVVTGSFAVAAVGAYWALSHRHEEHARICLRVGVIAGLIATVLMVFPTGDLHGEQVARHQPVTLAAMEGKFVSGPHAEVAIIGQPDVVHRRLENPIVVPEVLSYLAYGSTGATVRGLNDFPRDQWPDNVELLYYTYHIMVGLGTAMLLAMLIAAILLWRRRLYTSRAMLWVLMLAVPFPYLATSAGWMTAELGRQPWTVYGLQRTMHATSAQVTGGDVAFSTLGFLGLYFVVGVLFLFLVARQIQRGPQLEVRPPRPSEPEAAPSLAETESVPETPTPIPAE